MEAEEIKELYLTIPDYKNEPCSKGEMSHKERFTAIMDYRPFDRIVDTEFGYWDNKESSFYLFLKENMNNSTLSTEETIHKSPDSDKYLSIHYDHDLQVL